METRRKYYLHSYGCQMNKLDSELVQSKLRAAGYEAAADEDDADVVLLNTCSVRQHAEDKVWSRLGLLRQRKRRDRGLVVGVLGCMAQEHKRQLQARMPHVDLVAGPSAFGDIDVQLEEVFRSERRRAGLDLGETWRRGAGVVHVGDGVSGDTIVRDPGVRSHRSQAWVNVMRGCNMPCTYCIVPSTRGKEVSRPIEVIAEEVQRLVDDGVTEVTLLGQTVNAYGRDLGKGVTLARLLHRLHDVGGLRRIAFITSHPNFLSPELIEALRDLPRVSRFLHLPAQSGSNAVLRRMRRGYTVERYLMRWEALMAACPEMEIHSDWIVGYPGETEADLQATVEFMERVRFAQSYVFKYSPRPGTVAAELEDDVPAAVKAARNQALLAVQERHTREYNERLVGTVQEVLVEGESARDAARLTGRTEHHRIVHFPSDDHGLVGSYAPVRITEAAAHSLIGELVPAAQAR